jgi:hypothetical protein
MNSKEDAYILHFISSQHYEQAMFKGIEISLTWKLKVTEKTEPLIHHFKYFCLLYY